MIYKRVAARLRAQDWLAITIELAIVVIGVFIGTLVANWNAERVDKRAVERLIEQLQPKLRQIERVVAEDQAYYAVVRSYAKTAKAGWARDSAISDKDFVIAAFQATQLSYFNANPFHDGALLGVDEVRKIDDPETRDLLTTIITYESDLLNLLGEGSNYREQVRSIIPDEVQQRILADCGDQYSFDRQHFWLRPTCAVPIAPDVAVATAADLRARSDLVPALTSHMAHVTRHIGSDDAYGTLLKLLDRRITETRR